MSISKNRLMSAVAVGLVVLVFVSLVLFWARFALRFRFAVVAPDCVPLVSPTGLWDWQTETDLNTTASIARVHGTYVSAYTAHLGLSQYAMHSVPSDSALSRQPLVISQTSGPRNHSTVYYYDRRYGRFVYGRAATQDDHGMPTDCFYVGPEGVGQSDDAALGRFSNPILIASEWSQSIVIYDPAFRCFFTLRFPGMRVNKDTSANRWEFVPPTVRRGPELGDSLEAPYATDFNGAGVTLTFPSWRERDKQDADGHSTQVRPAPVLDNIYRACTTLLPVVDGEGRIHLLDRDSLCYSCTGGMLPETPVLFGTVEGKPANLLGYEVTALVRRQEDWTFHGLATGCMSPDYGGLIIRTSDEHGRTAMSATSVPIPHDPRRTLEPSKAVGVSTMTTGWGPFMVIGTYVIETLHPPVLQLTTLALGPRLPAGSGFRSLLLVPDSTIVRYVRANSGHSPIEKTIRAFLLFTPSLILSIGLALWVMFNAYYWGLGKHASMAWAIGTVAFGPAAWLTYLLVRPKIMQVTCRRCGRPRRPDQEACHWCGSGWDAPGLGAPAWRIVEA